MRLLGNLTLAGGGQVENARMENLAADPATPFVGQIWYNTTEGHYKGWDGTTIIAFATGGSTAPLQAELDAIELATGLNTDGTFAAFTNTNYINSATSIKNAEALLDVQVKATADALAAEITRATGAESTLTTNLAAEVTRATNAEGVLTTNLAAEVTRAQGAESTLTTNLAAEVTRATNAEGVLTTELAAEITRATTAEGALSTRVTAVEGSYINKDGSVAFTGNQSLNSHQLTNVGAPTAGGDAANKTYVDSKIGALGNAFEYVGGVVGGVDAASALDMATQTIQHAGAYYKVTTGGYFKVGAGAAFFANAGDGLIFNISSGIDIIDNTNSQVQGTTNFIAVTGSADVGFTVDVDANFKSRVSTVESGLSSEITRATTAEGTLTTNLAAEVTRAQGAESTLTTNLAAEVTRATTAEGTLTTNLAAEVTRAQGAESTLTTNLAAEVTRATGVEAALQTEVNAVETAVGLNNDGTFAALTGTNYINAGSSVINLSVLLDGAIKTLSDKVAGSTFVYTGSVAATSHVVAHALGSQYNQVTVYDSANKVIIPDSITADSTSQLTVTFASAITCRVVVTGTKA